MSMMLLVLPFNLNGMKRKEIFKWHSVSIHPPTLYFFLVNFSTLKSCIIPPLHIKVN